MNKKAVNELKKYIKQIHEKFEVEYHLGLLVLSYKKGYELKSICVLQHGENLNIHHHDGKVAAVIAKTGVIHKFYIKAIELMDKYNKYTVSLSKDSKINYLNVDKTTGGFFFSTNDDTDKVQAYFTKTEIENMKNDPRFKAINFDEAVIEEVEG